MPPWASARAQGWECPRPWQGRGVMKLLHRTDRRRTSRYRASIARRNFFLVQLGRPSGRYTPEAELWMRVRLIGSRTGRKAVAAFRRRAVLARHLNPFAAC